MTPSLRVAAVIGALVPSCSSSEPAQLELGDVAPSHLLPAGYLSTRGNQIVDQSGTPVRLACAGYFAPGDIPSDIAGMVSAGFNCLRYPWYNALLDQNLAQADQIVAAASQAGLKVILDHHGNEVPGPNNGWLPFPCNGLPFDLGDGTKGVDGCGDTGTVTRDRFVQDWVTVARHFAGNPTVIGYDLTNEPHLAPTWWADGGGGSTWGDGSATDIRDIYSQAGRAIQDADPGPLLICEGPFAMTGVLYNGETAAISGAADLSIAASHPVTVNVPNKIVYSVHDYPSTIGGATADSGDLKIRSMTQAWGYLMAQDIAPVWIGEMGGSLDGQGPDSAGDKLGDEQAWAATLIDYLNGKNGAQGGPTFSGNQQGVSTDWWAWGRLTGEEPDGTVGDNGQLRPEQYAIYSQVQYTAPTHTSCQASANDSVVTMVGPTLCDGAGNTWGLAADATIVLDGAAAPFSAHVIALAYVDGVLWQENASQLWWAYRDGGWAPSNGTATSPLPAPCTPSASGSVVTDPGAQLCDAGHNRWAITSTGTITINGDAAPFSANVIELAYVDGVIWQENTSQLWWSYTDGGWAPSNGTATRPVP